MADPVAPQRILPPVDLKCVTLMILRSLIVLVRHRTRVRDNNYWLVRSSSDCIELNNKLCCFIDAQVRMNRTSVTSVFHRNEQTKREFVLLRRSAHCSW